MSTFNPEFPKIVTHEQWLAERKELLIQEKEFTKQRDELNSKRRRLPMVKIEKEYTFEGPDDKLNLSDLFEGRRQLIIYHFMFHPDWDEGCPSCSFLVDNIGHLSHLHARNTTLALVSRAPLEKLEAYKTRLDWNLPWYSSHESDFNYDFHASINQKKGSSEYNYTEKPELVKSLNGKTAEVPGTSVFLRDGETIFHTYSSYARGGDLLLGTYNWLDLTALGRQEAWEKPKGRSDGPFMSWVRRHDQYD
ncbi:DUF899 domain-containing protein [Rhodohalobacter sp. SW132]|uniref:DUF899 domain-containing protein n=1 Tax=Rhodohalobacter sp. SW132 TaxID=2293433 RepID=UPI000E2459BA|nr:DUF899 domain-containing protein [Rhodohalobacter sp. SW132]REL24007.1 DUF899 domain-containing protein [Rhodohalobacter sp. SW132]